MKITEFKNQLAAKEKELSKLIEAHQESLLKFKIEDQHIIGGKDDCEECQVVKAEYQKILDFETENLGFNRMQATLQNIILLIEKVIEMKKEEEEN